MKAIKIKSYNVVKLLEQAGVVENIDGNKRQAHPNKVYVSKNDYKKIKLNTIKNFKKQYPNLKRKTIEKETGFYLLDLGPNTSLDIAIKDGWMIVTE